jgi:hypothetical protein
MGQEFARQALTMLTGELLGSSKTDLLALNFRLVPCRLNIVDGSV